MPQKLTLFSEMSMIIELDKITLSFLVLIFRKLHYEHSTYLMIPDIFHCPRSQIQVSDNHFVNFIMDFRVFCCKIIVARNLPVIINLSLNVYKIAGK